MYWNGDVVAKGVVVQNIYSKEQKYIYDPALYGYVIRCEEERRAGLIKLGKVSCRCHEDELNKCQKRS